MRFFPSRLIMFDPNPEDGGGSVEQLTAEVQAQVDALEKATTPEAKAEAKTKMNDALGKLKTAQAAAPAGDGTVDPKAHAAIKADLFNFKEKLRKEQEERQKLEKEKEEAAKQKMIAEQRFKELYEKEQVASAAEKKRSDAVVNSYVRDKKMSTLQAAAIKAGMKAEVLGDLANIDTSTVLTEVTVGDGSLEVKVSGADELIEALKQTRPWYFGKAGDPNIKDANGNPAGGGPAVPKPGTVTGNALLKLEKEQPAIYRAYIEQMLKGQKTA